MPEGNSGDRPTFGGLNLTDNHRQVMHFPGTIDYEVADRVTFNLEVPGKLARIIPLRIIPTVSFQGTVDPFVANRNQREDANCAQKSAKTFRSNVDRCIQKE
jgi:hypothetical protein